MPTTTQTPAVRPGSPELEELLARIAAGAEQRELERNPQRQMRLALFTFPPFVHHYAEAWRHSQSKLDRVDISQCTWRY